MRRALTLIFLIITSTCQAQTAVNNFTDKTVNGNQVTANIYGYPKYYDNNGTFDTVDTSIVASQDVGWDWEVKKGVYKLRIKNDGTFEINHLGDIISLKLNGLGFFNEDTKQRVSPSQTQVTLSNPTVSGSTITWALAGGSSYQIVYDNNILRDILTIGTTAKNFLKNNRPGTWTTDNTWVGLIYDIDTSQSTMIPSTDMESDLDINFTSGGRTKWKIRKSFAKSSNYQDPKYDSNGAITNPTESALKWPRRRIIKNGKYIEAILGTALDVTDNGTLIFNTTSTFQEGVSSYAGTTDNNIDPDNTSTNHDTGGLWLPSAFSSHIHSNLIKFDLSSITGPVTVSSASLDLRIKSGLSGDNCSSHVRRLLRDWTETGSTWLKYDGVNSWGTAGAANTTTDITASDDGSKSDSGISSPVTHTISNIATLVQGWINGTYANQGMSIFSDAEGDADGAVGDSEDVTSSNRPKLTVTYTATVTAYNDVWHGGIYHGGIVH